MRTKSRHKRRNLSISSRLTAIVTIMILIAYSSLTGINIARIGGIMNKSTQTTMSVLNDANMYRIRDAVDSVQTYNNTVQTVLANLYANGNTKGKMTSRVVNAALSTGQYEAEAALIAALRALVEENDKVYGAGVLLEPGAFSETAQQYALYYNKTDSTDGTGIENLDYNSYSGESYYAPARTSLTQGVSGNYEEDGTYMFTMYWPIVSDGTFKGTVIVDIYCDVFDSLGDAQQEYPGIEFSVIDDSGLNCKLRFHTQDLRQS